jgi:hypothetical protein
MTEGATGDARLDLALALARRAGRHAVAACIGTRIAWKGPGDRVLFPPDPAAYRGAAMPILAGNRAAHAEALSACRAVFEASGVHER